MAWLGKRLGSGLGLSWREGREGCGRSSGRGIGVRVRWAEGAKEKWGGGSGEVRLGRCSDWKGGKVVSGVLGNRGVRRDGWRSMCRRRLG